MVNRSSRTWFANCLLHKIFSQTCYRSEMSSLKFLNCLHFSVACFDWNRWIVKVSARLVINLSPTKLSAFFFGGFACEKSKVKSQVFVSFHRCRPTTSDWNRRPTSESLRLAWLRAQPGVRWLGAHTGTARDARHESDFVRGWQLHVGRL